MYTVGRIGSYIMRGVSTVSGPFHPFGGAVDIIVVEQPDGSFKSSPWYVRFGKFQGVLKAKENIVKVGVNGVDTDFYMYLDQRGEAYFLREAGNDAEESEAYTSSSSGDEMDRIVGRRPSKSNSFNFESKGSDSTEFGSTKIVEWTNSRRSRILGLVFGRRSLKADRFDGEDGGDPRVDRVDSLERAEIAADLLEMRWCTNIPAKNYRKDGGSRFGASSTLDSESKVDEVMAGIDDKGVAMSRLDDSAEHSLTGNVIDEVEPESTSGISGPTETNYLASNENISGSINIITVQTADGEEGKRLAKSLPYLRSQHGSFEHCGPDHPLASSLDSNYKYLEFSMRRKDDTSRVKPDGGMEEKLAMKQVSRISKSEDPSAGKRTPSQNIQVSGLYMVSFGSDEVFEPTGMIAVNRNERTSEIMPSKPTVPSGGNWRWPFSFKRSRPRKVAKSVDDRPFLKTNAKNMARTMTPASDQLSSLNLKEGCNSITFTFCTAMLGKQQVDARIYLWKSNTRVIISDVDGTITKSDVLGQFMPLVGMDWSQTGVAHLYSAIKENGYQLLFLSARAISQAYYTRQFLFKLKQDGKSLPDGPVVISPDGLFPSLYREVIRRAPHEFKIATLQDLRDLFPADHNPFYAGFGNRNTDEISYLKVGIPQGKIFTINPKGEIAVNKHINTKSYITLHALVNGMFPPIASFEQEDFNSWNYWKIPPPDIDI